MDLDEAFRTWLQTCAGTFIAFFLFFEIKQFKILTDQP